MHVMQLKFVCDLAMCKVVARLCIMRFEVILVLLLAIHIFRRVVLAVIIISTHTSVGKLINDRFRFDSV